MSKCVRHRTSGEIRRVKNAEAERLVGLPIGGENGTGWVYVPKSVWRADIRKPEVAA
jgi:hypothetical protein